MKTLTIVNTFGTKYWPLPVQEGLKSIEKHWPDHAQVLVYPDDMSQQLPLRNFKYYNLLEEQPACKTFIDRHKNNPELNPRLRQNKNEKKDFDKDSPYFYLDAIRFTYKVFACIDAYQKTKPDMMWYLDADIITFEKIPMSWLEHIIPDHAFTSYLGRPKKGLSETGFFAFNTAHKYAGEFFERWQTYYDEDRFLKLKGYTDSFTFDAARLELEHEGKIKNEDLNDGRWAGSRKARHPFINSELGQYMDHLKGYYRKAHMTSKKRDLTTKQKHPYWKTLKE